MTKRPFFKFVMMRIPLLLLFAGMLFIRPALSQNNPELKILYISNINGVLENCGCGNPSLGGLDYLAGTVAELRAKNPSLIYIDGGDFLNSYSFPALNRAIISAYQLIKPDILTPGDQEFIEDSVFISKHLAGSGLPFLASNLQWSPAGCSVEKIKKYSFGGQTAVFLSYLDSAAFEFSRPPGSIKFNEANFRKRYDQREEHQFLFVIYHGPQSGVKDFVKKYPAVDALLLGHQQSHKLTPDKKPALIGGGEDGAFLADLSLVYADGRFSLTAKQRMIKNSSTADSSVQKIIKRFKKTQVERGGSDRRK